MIVKDSYRYVILVENIKQNYTWKINWIYELNNK